MRRGYAKGKLEQTQDLATPCSLQRRPVVLGSPLPLGPSFVGEACVIDVCAASLPLKTNIAQVCLPCFLLRYQSASQVLRRWGTGDGGRSQMRLGALSPKPARQAAQAIWSLKTGTEWQSSSAAPCATKQSFSGPLCLPQ